MKAKKETETKKEIIEEEIEEKIEQEINQDHEDRAFLNDQNYFVGKKINQWFHFRTFSIIFLVLTILIIISFILMRYLNYYFNFGPMDSATAAKYKDANWFIPFNRLNWEVFPTFQNDIKDIDSNTVVVINNLIWAGTNMAVTRNALLINNIANGTLYIGTTITAVTSIILFFLHVFVGKPKVKSLMASWENITLVDGAKTKKKSSSKPKAKPTKAKAKAKAKPAKPKAKPKAKTKPTKAKAKSKAKPEHKTDWKARALKAESKLKDKK